MFVGGPTRRLAPPEEIESYGSRTAALHDPLHRHAEAGPVAAPLHYRPAFDEVHPEHDLRRGDDSGYRIGNSLTSDLRVLIDKRSAKRTGSARGYLENRSILADPCRGAG